MKLPTTPGEAVDLYYADDVDGYAERIVVECKSNDERPCWVVRLESGEHFDDEIEWMPGLPVSRLVQNYTKLALALRAYDNSVFSQFMRVAAKGSLELPGKFVKVSGWWVSWSALGDTMTGEPITDLEFSRPLCGAEMITMLDRMAKAFAAWRQEGYAWLG